MALINMPAWLVPIIWLLIYNICSRMKRANFFENCSMPAFAKINLQ